MYGILAIPGCVLSSNQLDENDLDARYKAYAKEARNGKKVSPEEAKLRLQKYTQLKSDIEERVKRISSETHIDSLEKEMGRVKRRRVARGALIVLSVALMALALLSLGVCVAMFFPAAAAVITPVLGASFAVVGTGALCSVSALASMIIMGVALFCFRSGVRDDEDRIETNKNDIKLHREGIKSLEKDIQDYKNFLKRAESK